ncbi:hypothetical protein BJ875DRAFT_460785 [Amylocarpus encephaloides]|uniref:tRNA-intron lyase n=1 Tax=Amylocarpus encephaloides TaxID=45428 RepID=A0A9P7YK98_9HELO|nr:hypothetical protein BJ875DRAFT_460785 [Amylocarpus encephaloides]
MAETSTTPPMVVPTMAGQPAVEDAVAPVRPSKPAGPTKYQINNQLYALPVPLRTFPLPTFVPHNPLSLLQILYTWVSQTISPPTSVIEPLYQGWFSPETSSIHVTDFRSIRGLWEQGFYGKGSFSRSEPNWLKAEKRKRAKGAGRTNTSEELTLQRRAQRQQLKWERARVQKEAIDRKLLEEAAAANSPDVAINVNSLPLEAAAEVLAPSSLLALDVGGDVPSSPLIDFVPPVGPLELLQLPNSDADITLHINGFVHPQQSSSLDEKYNLITSDVSQYYIAPVSPLELLALPNSSLSPEMKESVVAERGFSDDAVHVSPELVGLPNDHSIYKPLANGKPNSPNQNSITDIELIEAVRDETTKTNCSTHLGNITTETHINGFADTNGHPSTPKIKRQKSVRFSPTVEQTTFLPSEPPSPARSIDTAITNRRSVPEDAALEVPSSDEVDLDDIKDQEHAQLTLEEAFFLSYSLNALTILDPESKISISNQNLFSMFRRASYFPPLSNDTNLSPDDPFMINYVVYHHFRSLGWVVRSGVKFSVDYMLYVRGPVFTHAEFAVLILPSYSDPYWRNDKSAKGKEKRTWAWLSCINRVIAQVKKTLVLVYVDIPKPLSAEEELMLGIDYILGRYKVREIVMKRWISNRQRGK